MDKFIQQGKIVAHVLAIYDLIPNDAEKLNLAKYLKKELTIPSLGPISMDLPRKVDA